MQKKVTKVITTKPSCVIRPNIWSRNRNAASDKDTYNNKQCHLHIIRAISNMPSPLC